MKRQWISPQQWTARSPWVLSWSELFYRPISIVWVVATTVTSTVAVYAIAEPVKSPLSIHQWHLVSQLAVPAMVPLLVFLTILNRNHKPSGGIAPSCPPTQTVCFTNK